MKKIFTFLSAIFISSLLIAQDDLALAPPNGTFLAPISGCALTSTENVTVRIFNFGPGTVTSDFDVSYRINGGPWVTETVLSPSIPANTSYTYTFLAQADLSLSGSYTFDATVILAGDPTPGNDTYSGYIVNSLAPSDGGTVSGPSSVCVSGNSGFLTLGGHNGNVLRWEYSTDGGLTWVNISNTSTIQNYNNLTVPTSYRAVVQNASCAPANSVPLSIAIDPVTVGGSTSGAATVCSGANSGNITLSGHTGTINNWESSTDGGITWLPIANTTTTLSYLNLTQTTRYRAVVQSGSCPTANSSVTTITVNPPTVPGNLSPATTTVCSGSNSGTITLSGHSGSIIRWEFSTNSGSSWNNISNTTTSQSFTNLTASRLYRVRVQSSGCPALYSDTATVIVNPATVAGTLSGAATVCNGSNSGTLTLSGYAGSIVQWESSTDAGITWTNISNTTNTESYLNLVTTTRYRVRVQNGTCPALYSNSVDITVSPLTVGGTISGSTTVCSGSNSGSLTLGGHTGSIQRWESSIDNGTTWNTIANTTTTQGYTNLTNTTWYRVRVQSGVCAQQYSDTAIVTVAPSSVGGTLASAATVCAGINTGTLTLTGYAGSIIRWEFSTDGGSTWSSIANTTDTHTYNNLTSTTRFRVRVQNGSCPVSYSNFVDITVDPTTVGGTIAGSTTVCSGTNSGTLSLSGYTGNILEWEFSTDAGATWSSIANTTNTQTYSNLTTTTIYRAVIQSGVCSVELSDEATITVDPVTVGGTVSGATTVCSGANSGSVNLVGNVGAVLNWEFSTDNGNSWINISNTTTVQSYNNITTATMYRALVQSGLCSPAYSGTALIGVDQPSAGGTIFGATTVCSGSNSGTLSLIGSSGSVIDWEESNGGVTWTSTGITTTTYNYNNLFATTYYRAVVQNGVCAADYSSTAIINVDANSVGGTVSGSTTVCAGANMGTVTLSGETGDVIGWEFSTDEGNSWINLSNTTTSQSYSNLTVTTMYRARVKNGVCNAVSSAEATITVDSASDAGVLTGNATVCSALNNGTLTLSGYVGNIVDWEESNGGVIWSSTGNTSATHTYNNLYTITYYRAIVMNGSFCGADTSNTVIVTVDPTSVGGNLTSSSSVCSGDNNGTIYLSGETGNIIGWEISNDGGNNWMPVSNNTDSLVYNNLTQTSYYRVQVKSGVCNSTYSDTVIITVNSQSVAGTISGSTTICPDEEGSLTLNGFTGAIIDWESSSDGGLTWSSIGNTLSSYNYSGLQDTTLFRAIVMNGTCLSDTSLAAYVNIFAKPQASFTANDVCFGNAVSFENTSTINKGSIQINMWEFGNGNETVANSPSFNYPLSGEYTVLLKTVSNNNCIDTVSATVRVFDVPSAKISNSASTEFCTGESIQLSVNSIIGLSYLWSNGSQLSTLTVDSSGTYSVIVTNINTSCNSSDSIKVTALPSPVAFAGKDTSIAPGRSMQLNATGGTSYLWTPAQSLDFPRIANPLASPVTTTTYTVIVTDANGCSSLDSLTVEVKGKADFTVFSLITPNGDGFNDTWNIDKIELFPENEVVVFNRNGQTVFSASSYDNSWTGTYNGNELPDGTYYYILKFTNTGDIQKGAVNILRNQQ